MKERVIHEVQLISASPSGIAFRVVKYACPRCECLVDVGDKWCRACGLRLPDRSSL